MTEQPPAYPPPQGQAPPPYAPPPAPPAQAPPKKKTGLFIALAIVGVLLLCCCMSGIVAALAIPVFDASKGSAERRACFANERTVEGTIQIYKAEAGENAKPITDIGQLTQKLPTGSGKTVGPLVDEVPVCPAGGDYSLSGDHVTCSVHGNYADATSDEPDEDD
jgi:hypothetical protein